MANLQKLLSKLDEKLNYTEGHSIAIHQGLDLVYSTGSGLARVNPNVPMTSLMRMDVLSMSKTITAAGVVRQLLVNGLTPEEKIGGHLPNPFPVHSTVANLTFAHVLTHSGGLSTDTGKTSGPPLEFQGVEQLCFEPPKLPVGQIVYKNCNYSLLRVLLAYLANADALNGFPSGLFKNLSEETALMYVNYIQTHILGPSGVSTATVGPTNPDELAKWLVEMGQQAEWFNDNKGHLGDQHDPLSAYLYCGSDWWNMNVREYGRFIAHLINNKLQPNPWPVMRDTRAPGAPAKLPAYPNGDARLGVWRFQAPDGTGNYYGHNGGWSDAFTGWMGFPGGVSVTFFANSPIGAIEQERMILDSWLAS